MTDISNCFVTLPQWESRFPSCICRRDEHYWTAIEINVHDEWVFLVNLSADETRRIGARTVLVASFEQLLELIEDVGPKSVQAISGLAWSEGDAGRSYHIVPLSEIAFAEHSGEGWRKIFFSRAIANGRYHGPPAEIVDSGKLTSFVPIVRFGPPCEEDVDRLL